MTVSSKDQVIARLVREVLQTWGPDDLESFARDAKLLSTQKMWKTNAT